MTDEATAFVPGHVTGFFTVCPADDPAVAGSRGCGVTLTHGVSVTVRRADCRAVRLDGVEIDVDPVTRVLDALDATVSVGAKSDVPLGAGFGVSGAMALGTALATNLVLDCRRSANELVTIAHCAEVEAGTGLGDVVAQARGGVPIRLEPGGPAHNELDAIPASARVEYLSLGELSTEDVLGGDTDALNDAGERALTSITAEPTLERFLAVSGSFAHDAGLVTSRLETVLDRVEDCGGSASMAMLGETAFALGTGLSDAGYDPDVCSIHPGGATIVPE